MAEEQATAWICPWGICNHEQAQECRATLRPRNGCGGRFPPGTTPEQARVLAGPAPSPLDRWVDEIVRVAVELDHVAAEENNAESAATLRQELLRIVMMPPPAAGVDACPTDQPDALLRELLRTEEAMRVAASQAAFEQAEIEHACVRKRIRDFTAGVAVPDTRAAAVRVIARLLALHEHQSADDAAAEAERLLNAAGVGEVDRG